MNIFWYYPYGHIPQNTQVVIESPTDWLSAVLVLVAALVGAFSGSYLSHLLDEKREKTATRDKHIYAINMAVYKLSQQWLHTWNVFTQHIWDHFYNENRIIRISQLPIQQYQPSLIDLDNLGFLLAKTNEYKGLFLRLSEAQNRYKLFVETLNTRSKQDLDFQLKLQNSRFGNSDQPLSKQDCQEIVGRILMKNLKTSTDFMIELAREILICHMDDNEAFVSEMKKLYEGALISKFVVSKDHATKYGEIRNLLINERTEFPHEEDRFD